MYTGEMRPILADARQRVVRLSARNLCRRRRTGNLHHSHLSARHGKPKCNLKFIMYFIFGRVTVTIRQGRYANYLFSNSTHLAYSFD